MPCPDDPAKWHEAQGTTHCSLRTAHAYRVTVHKYRDGYSPQLVDAEQIGSWSLPVAS